MAGGYRILEHTADVRIAATGANDAESFASAAKALFSVMVDLRTVRVRAWVDVEATGESMEDLLVEWLNELIFQWETEGLLLREFHVREIAGTPDGWRIAASCGGEPFHAGRHAEGTHVKAAAYSGASVTREAGRVIARAILDV